MRELFRIIKYFSLGFSASSVLSFSVTIFFLPFKLSLIISWLVGLIYGLFCIGFMVRTLKVIEFEINVQNKDPQKGFHWYKEQIERQLNYMLYEKEDFFEGVIYHPRRLYRIFESPVKLTYNPYYITISSSRMMMRILLELVEIKEED